MKKIILLITFTLVINPYFALGSVVDVTLPNPDLDSNRDGWYRTGGSSDLWLSFGGVDNSGCLLFSISGITSVFTDILDGVNPGQSLTFTIYTKCNIYNSGFKLFIEWYDSTDDIIGSRLTEDNPTSTVYAQKSITRTAPQSPDAATKVLLGVQSTHTGNTGYIDAAAISGPAVPEFNLLMSSLVVFSTLITISFTIKRRKQFE